ncbi:MAG: hypothetical protein M0Q53_16425 [Prolixibacteraceae bacterium]|jgi:regulator of protease activity HflC (stomatin/prohibitin superfamily)|nr:hypothetical protein [Prolixibacteraceae bacterium]
MELLIPILIAIAVLIISGFRIAQEYERAIVCRLGRYNATKGPGLYWIIPLIDRQQYHYRDTDALRVLKCRQKFH